MTKRRPNDSKPKVPKASKKEIESAKRALLVCRGPSTQSWEEIKAEMDKRHGVHT